MAYEGEILHSPPPPHMFDFTRTSAVVVSGDGPNKWGHMLLNTGGVGGMYFQIAGVIAQPRYMNEAGYQRYLKETGKAELRRIPVFIRQPEAAQVKMEELLSEDWVWGGLVHNCETAVEEIIVAGGGPRIHQGLLSLPTHAGWSAWTCGARNCPGHSQRKHRCAGGIWMCNRIVPPCPGHVQSDQVCDTGTAWTCGARSCPTHSQRSHRCVAGVWTCGRGVPPCPGHSSPDHNCLQTG
jgi:hypothetical protein